MKRLRKVILYALITSVAATAAPISMTKAYAETAATTLYDMKVTNIHTINRGASTLDFRWEEKFEENDDYSYIVYYQNEKTSETKSIETGKKNFLKLEGLDYNTSYKIIVGVKGKDDNIITSDAVTFKTTNPDFLIIYADSLIKDGDSSFEDSLLQYARDLEYEGLNPGLLRVSAEKEGNGCHKCTKPEELKALIKEIYDDKWTVLDGFVLIGSTPDIPSAYWEYAADSETSGPSDLYYADMDGEWIDRDSDGKYDNYFSEEDAASRQEKYSVYTPELYFGRISPMGYVKTKDDEIKEIVKYLNKVHNYRVKGYNLPEEARNRGLIFTDCADFKTNKKPLESFNKMFSDVKGMFDDDETNIENYKNELNKGCNFANVVIHSSACSHAIHFRSDAYDNVSRLDIEELKRDVSPVANFISLNCCTACCFETDNKPCNNLGAYYLFSNDYVLNVKGGTSLTYSSDQEKFYDALAIGHRIGNAFLDNSPHFVDKETGIRVLLGDPTIKYNLNRPKIATPGITANLAGEKDEFNAVAYVDKYFRIGKTNSTEKVYYDIEGLPKAGCLEINNELYWMPSKEDKGNTYECKVVAYNKDEEGNRINKYEENFKVSVKDTAKGIVYEGENYTTSGVKINPNFSGGKASSKIGEQNPLVMKVTAKESGVHKILINYIADVDSTGKLVSYCGDGHNDIKYIDFVGEGSLDKVTGKEIELYLSKGDNTIILTSENGWTAAIDNFILLDEGEEKIYEAESQCNDIGGYVYEGRECSNNKKVKSISKGNELVFNAITVPESGYYNIDINYFTNENTTGIMKVNNALVVKEYSLDFKAMPTDKDKGSLKVENVYLEAGFNTITFTTEEYKDMADLDCIKISK